MRKPYGPSTIFIGILVSLFIIGWIGLAAGEMTSEQRYKEAQRAFEKPDFPKTLELVEPLLKKSKFVKQASRLKILSLVHLRKTPEGVDAYDQWVKASGKEDETLLREMAIHSILPLRTDMREQVRGSAYSALKEISSDDIVPYFEDGLNDGTGMIRALVAEGMGQLPAGLRSKRFRGALEDRAGLVRATVLKALGRSRDKGVVPLIKPLLEDEQEVVQVAAAGAMYRLGYTGYWGRIQKGAQVQEGYERGSALRMIGEIGEPLGFPILEQGLLDKQPSIRAAAVASLGKLGLSKAVPMLVPLLSEPVPAVRSVVAVTLGTLKAETAIPALTKALQDKNMGVRAAAVAGLLQMNSPFGMVSVTVRELMGQQNPAFRSSVAKALSHGRARDVVGTLTLLLNDPVPKPRISAARSLGRVGGREVIPVLKRTLKDPDEPVRATAAGAIARILSQPPEI